MARNDQRNQQNQQSNLATQEKPARPGYNQIRSLLYNSLDKLADVVPRHEDAKRLVSIATNLVNDNDNLQKCVPDTVLSSVHKAISLGLSLTKGFNEAFLIPRWNRAINGYECQFQIGYMGLCKLAYQSGAISYLDAQLVYENDSFDRVISPVPSIHHVPPKIGQKRGAIVAVYSHVKLTSGDDLYEVMDIGEVEAVRLRNREATRKKDGSYAITPWDTDYGEMTRKTVARRHCKRLPRSTDIARALAYDDELYAGMQPTVVHASPARGRLGRHQRGLAALQHRPGSDGDFEHGSSVEIETTFEPGTARPLYTEPEPPDAVPDDDPSGLGPGRQPGDD